MVLTPDLVKHVQIEYLMTLSSLLKLGQIDVATARATAQTFLKYLPFTTVEDLEAKINEFVTEYNLFGKLDVLVKQKKEELKTQEIMQKMTNLIGFSKT